MLFERVECNLASGGERDWSAVTHFRGRGDVVGVLTNQAGVLLLGHCDFCEILMLWRDVGVNE